MFRAGRAVTASTIIVHFDFGRKVRCHNEAVEKSDLNLGSILFGWTWRGAEARTFPRLKAGTAGSSAAPSLALRLRSE